MVGIFLSILRTRIELFFIFYAVKQVKDCLQIREQINCFYHLNERHYKVTLPLAWTQGHKENWDHFWASVTHSSSMLLPSLFYWDGCPWSCQPGRCSENARTLLPKSPNVDQWETKRKKKLSEKWFSLLPCPNNLVKTSNMQRKILNRLIRLIKKEHHNGNIIAMTRS